MSPPPIETSRGWLMITTAFDARRRAPSTVWAWLSLTLSSQKMLDSGDSWMFAPEAEYERHATSKTWCFLAAIPLATDGDTINLYYGAADSSIALAHGSISQSSGWLDANGHSEQAHDRRQRQS